MIESASMANEISTCYWQIIINRDGFSSTRWDMDSETKEKCSGCTLSGEQLEECKKSAPVTASEIKQFKQKRLQTRF